MKWEPNSEQACFQYVGHRHPDNGNVVWFDGPVIPGTRVGAYCYYERVGYGRPKKGQWYLSGAIVHAYQAPNDLPTEYVIVKPLCVAEVKCAWTRAAEVKP